MLLKNLSLNLLISFRLNKNIIDTRKSKKIVIFVQQIRKYDNKK